VTVEDLNPEQETTVEKAGQLQDRSRFEIRRAEQAARRAHELVADSKELHQHAWTPLRLGRICERCRVVQARDEYQETECTGS
jgi:hypothetical protein